jgi:VCBS repeat-containing protein
VPGIECTLRAAVQKANATAGADTIRFDAALDTLPIILTIPTVDQCPPPAGSGGCWEDADESMGDLDILDDLTIVGNGARKTIIQWPDPVLFPAAPRDRIFEMPTPRCYSCVSLGISGVTLRYGGAPSPTTDPHGGIEVGGANVLTTITDSVVSDNAGSGITAWHGTLLLDRVTVARNIAARGAGLSAQFSASFTIANSTFSDNVADDGAGGGAGGAVHAANSNSNPDAALVVNSTLSGNRAAKGCAVFDARAANMRLYNVTMADNCTAGSGRPVMVASADGEWFGSIALRNSVVASPAGVVDCAIESAFGLTGSFTTEGFNLLSDASCALAGAGDVQGTDALLGPLADNGGPTWTHLPLPGSAAIDTGTLADCPATDQRGFVRPIDGNGDGVVRCDKGAVEAGTTLPPPPTATIRGTTWDDTTPDGVRAGEGPLPGVQVCLFPSAAPCQPTDGAGTYAFPGLSAGTYHVYVRLPAGRIATTDRVRRVDAVTGVTTTVDFGLYLPLPIPAEVTVETTWYSSRVPVSARTRPLHVTVTPTCAAASVVANLGPYAGPYVTQSMTAAAGNTWETTFAPPFLLASTYVLTIQVTCANGTTQGFGGYIQFVDPSGTILDGCTGQPLAGATVTLFKNDPAGSASYVIPDPSETIPSTNPETTSADGLYAWDVVPGRWRVQASKAGYDTVTTDPFDVPPPKLGLDITLMPAAGCNTPPVANNDAYGTDQAAPLTVSAPGVLGNDTDADHDVLHAVLVTNAAHGAVTLAADGSFTYAPSATFFGADSFTYKASDGRDDSNVATVTITVRKVNRPPVAKDDAYTTTKNRAFFIAAPGVLANDKDPEGSSLTAVLVQKAAHGVVLLSANGAFVYLPKHGFVGKDTFTYRASDGVNVSNIATVTVNVVRKDKHDNDDDDDRGEHEHGEKERR